MAAEEKWYFSKEQLENSPSRKCDIDSDKELSYRQQAANFIQDVGQRLQVTQLCINTAIVYMHRFYVFHSFTQFHRYSMAAAALFLAAKVEEQPRKLEHVIKVAHICLHKEEAGGSSAAPDVKSEQYAQLAHDLVFNENVLLQTLGFDVAIDHPHTHVVRCCHLVKASKDLAQTSYFLASNSLHLTTMCLQYKPTVVACFCIHLACKWSNWEIPPSSEGKPWFHYVDESVTTEMLDELTKEFISIYNKCPSRLKKKIQSMSASLGQSSSSNQNTPTNNPNSNSSTNSTTGGGGVGVSGGTSSQSVNNNSPMTADGKKLHPPQHTKDGVPYHSKNHHGQQPKPGVAHPHRPNMHEQMTLEYKEKKERERQTISAAGTSHNIMSHHKQPPPGTQEISKHSSSSNIPQNHKHGMPPLVPSHNRNPHHRSSSANMDPKMKMHPSQMHHASSSRSSTNQLHPPHQRPDQPNVQHPRNIDREQMHRELNQHGRSSDVPSRDHSQTREHSQSQSREPSVSRDPYRELSRMSVSRDMTAPRDAHVNKDTTVSSITNISSEREMMKEQQMRERHHNVVENVHLKDHLFREPIDRSRDRSRERTPNDPPNKDVLLNKHRSDLFNKDSNNSVSELNKDSENKHKYEQSKQYKMPPNSIGSVPQSNSGNNNSNSNNNSSGSSSGSSRHRSSSSNKDLLNNDNVKSSSHSTKPTAFSAEQIQKKSSSSTIHATNKPNSSYATQSQISGNTTTSSTSQSTRAKQPPYLNTSLQETNKSSVPMIPTSSPDVGSQQLSQPSTNQIEFPRNGSYSNSNSNVIEEKRPIPIESDNIHSATQSTSTPPVYKQKSIFSPEKEISKTPTKKSRTAKTPPSSRKDASLTDFTMIPPALSPFGSPPPLAPSTPNAKNRNRTSSSSSEPELMVVINKLENIKGYEHMMKDSKSGIKLAKSEQENIERQKEKKYSGLFEENDLKGDTFKQESKDLTSAHVGDPNVGNRIKDEPQNINTAALVNGTETDPTVISNLLKEVAPINHLSVAETIKKEESTPKLPSPAVTLPVVMSSAPIPIDTTQTSVTQSVVPEVKKSEHHKSEKKKKKEKHKHKDKDKDRNRDDREKKKKHKDKDRDRHRSKESVSEPPPMAPLKITIAKDKITPPAPSDPPVVPGLKIKIPKERIKTETIPVTNSNPAGGLKIKISKDKIVENTDATSNTGGSSSGTTSSSRKRDRDSNSDTHSSAAPPTKVSKSSSSYSSSRSSDSSRQNGRSSSSSYNSKQQVSLSGEGAQVGGVAVGVLQPQAQWSTQVKLAESKYHSKVSNSSNKQPPT